jgi:hypothetical protein
MRKAVALLGDAAHRCGYLAQGAAMIGARGRWAACCRPAANAADWPALLERHARTLATQCHGAESFAAQWLIFPPAVRCLGATRPARWAILLDNPGTGPPGRCNPRRCALPQDPQGRRSHSSAMLNHACVWL